MLALYVNSLAQISCKIKPLTHHLMLKSKSWGIYLWLWLIHQPKMIARPLIPVLYLHVLQVKWISNLKIVFDDWQKIHMGCSSHMINCTPSSYTHNWWWPDCDLYDTIYLSFSVRHALAVMHVGIANSRWRGKRSRHSRRMRNPQLCVSGKRSMVRSYRVASPPCCIMRCKCNYPLGNVPTIWPLFPCVDQRHKRWIHMSSQI